MDKSSLDSIPLKRDQWGRKVEFFLATSGLGALTRFPYLCMKNGGGAFLIPFTIGMIVAGAPLFYLEVLLGQFSGQSPLTVWKLCPAFRGLGYSMSLLSLVASVYYMPFTWSSLFFIMSLRSEVPWKTCNNEWNTPACRMDVRNTSSLSMEISFSNTSSNITDNRLSTGISFSNADRNITETGIGPRLSNATYASATEEFWNYRILGITHDGLENIGGIRWEMATAHFFCWLAVFLCSMKGARTAGKVVYVTATLPYFLLLMLLVRGVSLDGAIDGIKYFLIPNFEKLKESDVWLEAFIQVFYQLGPAWGALITMASYNKFHHRCYYEAIFVPIVNLITALVGGIAIFSTFGFMAKRYGMDISEVVKSGPGLSFVAYPEAIAQMPFAPFWACIFFLTIVFVAIDSQFGMFETYVSGFLDFFPQLRRWKVQVAAVFASFCFLVSLTLCTEGGMYIYQLLDWYSAALSFTMIGFFECIVVGYFYGIKRFYSDVKLMFGSPPNHLLTFAWLVATPTLMAVLAFYGVWNLKPLVYKFTNYAFPDWAILIGWMVSMISVLPTPVMFIYVLRFRKAFRPDPSWVPNCPEIVDSYRKCWQNLADTASNDDSSVPLNE